MNLNSFFSFKVFRSAIAFQSVWFALILLPSFWAGISVLIYLFFHRQYVSQDNRLWLFSLRLCIVGVAVDAFFFYSGVMQNFIVSSSTFESGFIPLWLVGLWLCFSLAMPVAFSFLKKHYALCVIFGFIGAPTSYFSGAFLRGDVSFMEPQWMSLFYIGSAWALILCLAVFWLRNLDTVHQKQKNSNSFVIDS